MHSALSSTRESTESAETVPKPIAGRTGDVLGHARVSTADQDAASQHDRLEEAGAIRIFTDIVSRAAAERPELARLIGDLRSRGIRLTSLEEWVDTSSAAGELVFHLFGAITHFERRLISERTSEGLAAARRRGSRPRRPPIDPEKVAALRKLVDAGMTPGKAARQLGIGRSTANRSGRDGEETPEHVHPGCVPEDRPPGGLRTWSGGGDSRMKNAGKGGYPESVPPVNRMLPDAGIGAGAA